MEQFPLRWFRSSVCPNHNNPQTKPAVLIGNLAWDADLVAVEVVENGNRVRAYRIHSTSGLEVSCRLLLAIHPTMFL